MRGAADRGHVQHVAVRVARRLEEHVDLPAGVEPDAVVAAHAAQRRGEIVDGEAVEPAHGDVEVGALAVPVVQQLVGAAIDVAAREHDVAVAEQVGERGVDRGHAGVEVPREILARQRPGLDVDDVVGEADRGGVQQPRVDLVQQLAAAERILDPLRAGVEIGRGARDHRRRREDRGDVVEQRVRAAYRGIGAIAERLVGRAQRVLQRVEDLGELEAHEALGVEPRGAVAPVERPQAFHCAPPQLVRGFVGAIELRHELAERASGIAAGVDREVAQLLGREFVGGDRRGAVAARREFAARDQPGVAVSHEATSRGPAAARAPVQPPGSHLPAGPHASPSSLTARKSTPSERSLR